MANFLPKGVRPSDAEFSENCMFYKRGVHNFLFYWAGPELGWLRSSRPENDVLHMQNLSEDY